MGMSTTYPPQPVDVAYQSAGRVRTMRVGLLGELVDDHSDHLLHAVSMALHMPRRVYAMVCAEAGADRTNEAARRNVVAVAR